MDPGDLAGRHNPSITRAGRVFFTVTTIIALGIGGLQMYRVHGGWLTNYGADVFGTAWLYAMGREGRTFFQGGRSAGPWRTALVVFGLCAISEFGQRWHLVPGRFDPLDLAAYGATVCVCVLLDRLIGPFAVSG